MAEFILKDWYGKEQSFDEETIYVKDKEGKLLPFTHGTGNPVIEPLEVTENGTYEVPAGVDGYAPVVVNVPDNPPVLQAKEATKNGEVTPDSGYDGLSKVTVNVPDPVLEPLNVTANGSYTPGTGKDGFNSVTVAVPAPEIKLQEKTITENGEYTADAGFDGLGKVLVDVKGGGGLPAGGYWKPEMGKKPYSSTGFFFQYNGKRYWYGISAYNDTKRDIYLYENDVYTLVATDVNDNDLTYAAAIEYNGKVHFLGYDSSYLHFTWDGGASFAKLNALPAVTTTICFVMDGELIIKTKSSGFYRWVEASDTWEAISVSNCPNTNYETVAVIDRKIYIAGYKKLYEVDWDAKICTLLGTAVSDGISGRGSLVAFGRYIYCRCSGSNASELCALYKYHVDNKTYEYVAGLPHNNIELYLYNNRIYASCYNGATHFHAALYEVTE